MANFGIGLGAFASGLSGGIRTGLMINQAMGAQADKDAIKDEFAKAQPEYDAAIADNVLTQAGQQHAQQQQSQAAAPAPQAQPGGDVKTVDVTGAAPAVPEQPGLAFDVDKANAKAKDTIGSFNDFTYSTVLPKLVNKYLEQGNLEAAEKLSKWSEDKAERKQTERFGQVLNAFQAGQATGDYDGFGSAATKLLGGGNYGMKAKGFEIIKDGDGRQAGIRFDLERDGKAFQHTFNSMGEAGEFLAGQADPRKRAEQYYAQQAAASKFKSQVAFEEAKKKIGLGADVTLEGVKAGNKIKELDVRNMHELQQIASRTKQDISKVQKDAEYKIGVLRQNKFTPDEIRELLPALLGAATDRKGASVGERVRMTRQELIRSKEGFADMSEDDQNALVRRIVEADTLIAKEMQGKGSPVQQPGLGANNNLNVLR